MRKILIATHNSGKLREYCEMLSDLPVKLLSLTELDIREEVEETGTTFAENAIIKAEAYQALSGLPTLADDSGLEVDALDGAPGVYSSRYAGEGASDRERYLKLLTDLRGIPEGKRSARFRCVVALTGLGQDLKIKEGVCEGVILFEPLGENGFGYDPVFFIPSEGRTMAELPPGRKNQISHRARALRELRSEMHSLLSSRD